MSAPAEPDPPPQKLVLGKAEFERVNEPAPPGEPPSIDALEMLRQNRVHEKAAGTVFDQSPAPVPGKYRKYLDYAVMLVVVDSVLGYELYFAKDPYGLVCFSACLLLFTSGWSWFGSGTVCPPKPSEGLYQSTSFNIFRISSCRVDCFTLCFTIAPKRASTQTTSQKRNIFEGLQYDSLFPIG
jgi:hypothetical protein